MGASRPISFRIGRRSTANLARLGRVETPHGGFDTPAFMPVATAAAMKGLTPSQVRSTGSQIILNNAYHLLVRVGVERMRAVGGSHRFMRWDGPMLTDSGGFQAFSMSGINALDEEGVTFRSFVDGSRIRLGPRESMEIQNAIGADIIMAFDDCPPGATTAKRRGEAHERTLRWLAECIRHHARPGEQALFGIVQGGTDLDLRRRSVEGTCGHDLPGYAIGGVAVGEGTEEIRKVVEFTAPLLPEDRPRYLMGVGYERDIVMAVAAGVDMFDCVLPTRNGRNAFAFTRNGPLRLRNARFALDPTPIEEGCDCETCAGGFSRAYLRHLFAAEEMLGPTLVSLHNVRHFQRLMLDIRSAIAEDAWSSLPARWPVLSAPQDGDPEGVTGEARDSNLRLPPMNQLPTLLLAQDAPGLAGQPAAPATASTATSGTPGTPSAKPQPQGMDGSILFMMLAAFGVIIVMQIFGSRKERKKRDALLGGLKRNDRVQTAGGVIGAIVEVKPETVVLKVDENSNTRITFAKSAIVAVLNAAEGDKAEAKA